MFLCPPAILYIILSVISIIFLITAAHLPIIYILLKILFVLLWTWLLNYICVSGYQIVSWILVLFPLIILILLIIFGIVALKKLTPEQINSALEDN